MRWRWSAKAAPERRRSARVRRESLKLWREGPAALAGPRFGERGTGCCGANAHCSGPRGEAGMSEAGCQAKQNENHPMRMYPIYGSVHELFLVWSLFPSLLLAVVVEREGSLACRGFTRAFRSVPSRVSFCWAPRRQLAAATGGRIPISRPLCAPPFSRFF